MGAKDSVLRLTPLAAVHRELGARMVPFAGWEMPVEYSGIIAEHQAVRTRAGLFDVSHMGELLVEGPGAAGLLERAMTNRVEDAPVGRCVYSPMCNEAGGTVEDLIALCLAPDRFLLVVNAANREKDFRWLRGLAVGAEGVEVGDVSDRYALLAIQGPEAKAVVSSLAREGDDPADLRPFRCGRFNLTVAGEVIISRTGYTGEDGFEVFCRPEAAADLWAGLLEVGRPYGLVPVGLGARDTLRLEAALPLYGHELAEDISPLEAGLDRFVDLTKEAFMGRDALVRERERGPARRLVGLAMGERGGLPRHGYPVLAGDGDGTRRAVGLVTSGSFAPTLGHGVALALVEARAAGGEVPLAVEVRGRPLPVSLVKLPFHKRIKPK